MEGLGRNNGVDGASVQRCGLRRAVDGVEFRIRSEQFLGRGAHGAVRFNREDLVAIVEQ